MYAPTFGKTVLHLSTVRRLLVTLLVGVSNFFWLPIGGALSDRIGRRPVLIAMALLAIATAYPALSLLVQAPSFVNMLLVLLWLSFIYGMYNGAMIAGADGNHAGRSAGRRFLARLQPGDGGVRRIHAGDVDLR